MNVETCVVSDLDSGHSVWEIMNDALKSMAKISRVLQQSSLFWTVLVHFLSTVEQFLWMPLVKGLFKHRSLLFWPCLKLHWSFFVVPHTCLTNGFLCFSENMVPPQFKRIQVAMFLLPSNSFSEVDLSHCLSSGAWDELLHDIHDDEIFGRMGKWDTLGTVPASCTAASACYVLVVLQMCWFTQTFFL